MPPLSPFRPLCCMLSLPLPFTLHSPSAHVLGPAVAFPGIPWACAYVADLPCLSAAYALTLLPALDRLHYAASHHPCMVSGHGVGDCTPLSLVPLCGP